MYQVLLADDEESIMDSMLNHIPWAQYNMEVAYTATSGKQAYDILVNTPLISQSWISACPGTAGWSCAEWSQSRR